MSFAGIIIISVWNYYLNVVACVKIAGIQTKASSNKRIPGQCQPNWKCEDRHAWGSENERNDSTENNGESSDSDVYHNDDNVVSPLIRQKTRKLVIEFKNSSVRNAVPNMEKNSDILSDCKTRWSSMENIAIEPQL